MYIAWFDDHPYIAIYLAGCAVVPVLMACNWLILQLVNWITKDNIVQKNLRKLESPDEQSSFGEKMTLVIFSVVLNSALSWISVILIPIMVAWTLLKVVRDLLAPVPESVKELRFPLRINPDLPPEFVWAYVKALKLKVGESPLTADQIFRELDMLSSNNPRFSKVEALRKLKQLNVASPEVIDVASRFMLSEQELEKLT